MIDHGNPACPARRRSLKIEKCNQSGQEKKDIYARYEMYLFIRQKSGGCRRTELSHAAPTKIINPGNLSSG